MKKESLLHESLGDYGRVTNPVRVVDVFVDELDVVTLGFAGAIPADTGLLTTRDLGRNLHLRLFQPHPGEPTFGARSPTDL